MGVFSDNDCSKYIILKQIVIPTKLINYNTSNYIDIFIILKNIM